MTEIDFKEKVEAVLGKKTHLAFFFRNGKGNPILKKVRCGKDVIEKGVSHLVHWENGHSKDKRIISRENIRTVIDADNMLAVVVQWEDGSVLHITIDK